jgi:hypothetical protein
MKLKNAVCVDIVRTDVSEELFASMIRVTRIGKLGTMLATEARGSYIISTLRASVVSYC